LFTVQQNFLLQGADADGFENKIKQEFKKPFFREMHRRRPICSRRGCARGFRAETGPGSLPTDVPRENQDAGWTWRARRRKDASPLPRSLLKASVRVAAVQKTGSRKPADKPPLFAAELFDSPRLDLHHRSADKFAENRIGGVQPADADDLPKVILILS